MNVTEAIYHRRAVREYTDQPIDEATLAGLVDAAIQAPSAMDLQPWAFSIVVGRQALGRIARLAKAHLLERLDEGSPLQRYRERLRDPAFDIFYGAPALIAVVATSDDEQAEEDCCLAGQNLMLAACAQGLGSCCIGFARPWLNTLDGKATLRVPSGASVVLPIVVGHPVVLPPAPGRRPADIRWIGRDEAEA